MTYAVHVHGATEEVEQTDLYVCEGEFGATEVYLHKGKSPSKELRWDA